MQWRQYHLRSKHWVTTRPRPHFKYQPNLQLNWWNNQFYVAVPALSCIWCRERRRQWRRPALRPWILNPLRWKSRNDWPLGCRIQRYQERHSAPWSLVAVQNDNGWIGFQPYWTLYLLYKHGFVLQNVRRVDQLLPHSKYFVHVWRSLIRSIPTSFCSKNVSLLRRWRQWWPIPIAIDQS